MKIQVILALTAAMFPFSVGLADDQSTIGVRLQGFKEVPAGSTSARGYFTAEIDRNQDIGAGEFAELLGAINAGVAYV